MYLMGAYYKIGHPDSTIATTQSLRACTGHFVCRAYSQDREIGVRSNPPLNISCLV
jgi:hypothetical protein